MSKIFTGVFTALVTPFTSEDKIDFDALEKLVEEQIEAGCGILINGTTAESPTIEEDEFVEIAKFVMSKTQGRVQVILGTGSNNTKHTVEKSQLAEKLGADGVLIVNPYYNKPTQEGLYQHFKAVANAINIPVIIYNIKGRTAVNVETDTLLRLAEIDNIVAVKEASGDIAQIEDVCKRTPEDFSVLLGDDGLVLKCMSEFKADGGISVLSNIFPSKMVEMVDLIKVGKLSEAKAIHDKYEELMGAVLSIGNNPIAVKTIMAERGQLQEQFRLPLCPLSVEQKSQLMKIYNKAS